MNDPICWNPTCGGTVDERSAMPNFCSVTCCNTYWNAQHDPESDIDREQSRALFYSVYRNPDPPHGWSWAP